MITYEQLVNLDQKYFKPEYCHEEEDMTEEEVARRLATWLFDHEGNVESCRKKVKNKLPQVYVRMLECFVDGDHDT